MINILQTSAVPSAPVNEHADIAIDQARTIPSKTDAEMRAVAQEFEAVFISQMLTFSGLDKALTAGGGQSASAFTSFYIDQIAADISENGGFGLADKFYENMKQKASPAITDETVGDINVKR